MKASPWLPRWTPPSGLIRLDFPWKSSCGKVLGAYNTARKALGAADDLQNNDEGYYRKMPVNYGLYNSINTATFAEAAQLDFCGIQRMVDAVGLHSGVDNAPVNMHQLGNLLGAIGVAPLHLANAFATFANDGQYCAPIAIAGVTDASGRKLPAQISDCRSAVRPEVARGVNSVLQDVLKRGPGSTSSPRSRIKSRSRPRPARPTTTARPGWWATPPALPPRPSSGTPWKARNGPARTSPSMASSTRTLTDTCSPARSGRTTCCRSAGLYPAAAFPAPPESMTKPPPPSPPQ